MSTATAYTPDVARDIVDFARERGIHSMATPEEEPRLLQLAEKIVDAAKNVYRNGTGNTSDSVTGVLQRAGIETPVKNGVAEVADGEEVADDGAAAAPVGEAQEAETGEEAGEEATGDGQADGEPGGSGAPPEEEAAPDDEGQEPGDDVPTEEPSETADAEPELGGEAAEEGVEGEAADEGPGEALGEAVGVLDAGSEGQPSGALSLPLRKQPSSSYVRALERVAKTRLPVPTDVLEEEPEPLPSDITGVDDAAFRKLYWQRHALYVYARWMVARTESALRDAKFAEASAEEINEHSIVLGELKALRDFYNSDVEAMSREWTMRSTEKSGPAPFSR